MRVACILVEHLPAQVEARDNPPLKGRPLVIGGLARERKAVLDCSQEAARAGVAPGMSLRQAFSLCPDAIFLAGRKEEYETAFHEILSLLDQFSPVVESEGLGVAYLEVSGLERLFGPEEQLARRLCGHIAAGSGLEARAGLASSKFVAQAAARLASTEAPVIVGAGLETEFLKELPVDLLPTSAEMKRALALLGLRSLGQLASLPGEALEGQFGKEGLVAHHLAQGIDPRPVAPRAAPPVLEAERFPGWPFETMDSLLSATGRLLDGLVAELKRRNSVCARIGLRFHLEGGSAHSQVIHLKTPTAAWGEMLQAVKARLERVRWPESVSGVQITLSDLSAEEGAQDSLMPAQRSRAREKVKGLARRLRARFGRKALARVVPLEPNSRIPERRHVLIDLEE